MKKVFLGVMLMTVLVLAGVPTTEVEARGPSCVYIAEIMADHAGCDAPQAVVVSGLTLADCEAAIVWRTNWIINHPDWSNPVTTQTCHAFGDNCPVAAEPDDVAY